MSRFTRYPLPCALAAIVLVTAGCGDDDRTTTTTAPAATPTTAATAPPATTPEREATPPPPATTSEPADEPAPGAGDGADQPTGDPSASAGARERLEAAGYDVTQSQIVGVDPQPRAALELPLAGGGDLTVYVYDRRADARRKAAELRPLAEQGGPRYVELAVEGATVYFALVQEEGEQLDRAEVARVIAAAEGR